MDGVRLLSVCCCGMAVVCGAAGLPGPVCVAYAIYSHAVLLSTAVMSPTVTCRVCGVWWCVSSCGVRVVGYPLSAPPSQRWWVGALWMVGWHDEVGWHSVEGRVL